ISPRTPRVVANTIRPQKTRIVDNSSDLTLRVPEASQAAVEDLPLNQRSASGISPGEIVLDRNRPVETVLETPLVNEPVNPEAEKVRETLKVVQTRFKH